MIRAQVYTPEIIVATIARLCEDNPSAIKLREALDGDMVNFVSKRMRTFWIKGTRCCRCGLEGTFFAKEKREKDISYHLNLYGKNGNGEEILMTHDHIIPRSHGGIDWLDNMQTMCTVCNGLKSVVEGADKDTVLSLESAIQRWESQANRFLKMAEKDAQVSDVLERSAGDLQVRIDKARSLIKWIKTSYVSD